MNRADNIRRLCEQRGIRIIPRGRAFHVVGPGVDILCADLRTVSESDLTPAKLLSRTTPERTAGRR
jgi:hypothetical protein